MMSLHENSHNNFMKLKSFTPDLLLKTQLAYSDSRESPLNLYNMHFIALICNI